MAVMVSPAFPVSILGTVVNRSGRFRLLRSFEPSSERLLFTYARLLNWCCCKLNEVQRFLPKIRQDLGERTVQYAFLVVHNCCV
jgi:hypothetical protein